mgnify:CR=1 FL=1
MRGKLHFSYHCNLQYFLNYYTDFALYLINEEYLLSLQYNAFENHEKKIFDILIQNEKIEEVFIKKKDNSNLFWCSCVYYIQSCLPCRHLICFYNKFKIIFNKEDIIYEKRWLKSTYNANTLNIINSEILKIDNTKTNEKQENNTLNSSKINNNLEKIKNENIKLNEKNEQITLREEIIKVDNIKSNDKNENVKQNNVKIFFFFFFF